MEPLPSMSEFLLEPCVWHAAVARDRCTVRRPRSEPRLQRRRVGRLGRIRIDLVYPDRPSNGADPARARVRAARDDDGR